MHVLLQEPDPGSHTSQSPHTTPKHRSVGGMHVLPTQKFGGMQMAESQHGPPVTELQPSQIS